MSEHRARFGWESDFPTFQRTEAAVVRERLKAFVSDASPEQVRAWADSIPPLQREVEEALVRDALAERYSTILEYELPLESRRPDVLLLVANGVLVLELKGKSEPSQADVDQAAAYARDLRCYHRECANCDVVPVLVPTRAKGYLRQSSGVHIAGPDALDALIAQVGSAPGGEVIDRTRFLDEGAYRPLPTLVAAARELLKTGELRRIHRARAATEPAVEAITAVVHKAAATKSRHLVLLTGVPGAGKTLVGLQTVHAHYLDDLAVERPGGKPTAPAVFLSGNGPLVEVLQYELRSAGGGGRVFVRDVKNYVKTYSGKKHLIPNEHVLVFDEAQRAYDAEMVGRKHQHFAGSDCRSEPEHFIEFAERVPSWCVVVGLIGSGQEIHVGEEAGLTQWRKAVEGSGRAGQWTVHGPAGVEAVFADSAVPFRVDDALNLDTEIRFHLATDLHRFVAGLLTPKPAEELSRIASHLEKAGYHLRLTRSLETAKAYLRERYADNQGARFGLVASSRDKSLPGFGVTNDYQSTKNVRVGPWYGDNEDAPEGRSCRLLDRCVTEFGAQGLELDSALLAWGTDLALDHGVWSNAMATRYKRGTPVRDPLQLRLNAYRVLLTRGRDATVVFVPTLPELDETYSYLKAAGFLPLD
ncbi:MAG: DNA/RNA helicase domain-containing protein [Vicinamibacterales bacterium]